MTLLLAHGYELLPEISEFSTNAIPTGNPYTRTRIKDTCLCDLYLRLLLDVSLISMYLSTPREQKGVTFLVCDSARRNIITACYKPATLTSNALRVAKGTRPLSVDNEFFLVSLGHWWPRNKNDQNLLPLAILGSSTAEDPEGMQELQDSKC